MCFKIFLVNYVKMSWKCVKMHLQNEDLKNSSCRHSEMELWWVTEKCLDSQPGKLSLYIGAVQNFKCAKHRCELVPGWFREKFGNWNTLSWIIDGMFDIRCRIVILSRSHFHKLLFKCIAFSFLLARKQLSVWWNHIKPNKTDEKHSELL